MRQAIRTLGSFSTAIFMVLLVVIAPAAQAGETFTIDSSRLEVKNLIGAIDVQGASGGDFVVEVHERGSDAGVLDIDVRRGGDAAVLVKFPVDRERNYVYPEMGRGSRTEISVGDRDSGLGGLLSAIFGGKGRVRVKGSGSGLEVWADMTVKVPRGAEAEIFLGVGSIMAKNVDGELMLDTSSGSVDASDIRGTLRVDTGSGRVNAHHIDAGSDGEINIDTGSGQVELENIIAREIMVDTGSGRVEMEQVEARLLEVDTGSGRVSGFRISTDDAVIDTGSGGIELVFDEIGQGTYSMDTGSGGIQLELPGSASAHIRASTGSGGVRIDAPGANVRRMKKDEADVIIGGGGARFDLDTGSGGIRVTTR